MSLHETSPASWAARLKLPLVLLAAMLIGGALVAGVVLALNDGGLPRTAVAPVSSTVQVVMPTEVVMATVPAGGAGVEALPNPHSGPSDAAPVQRLAVADAKAQLDAGTAVFIDVRSGAEFAKGHIDNALSITSLELEERMKALPPDRLLVVYGADGVESAVAGAQIFRDLGFAQVAALDGGLEAWQMQGFPVASGS